MDRAHRQELKHDRFVEQVGHTVEYAAGHRQQVIRYGAIALAVLVLALAAYWYFRSQEEARQEALRTAIRTQEAQVGQGQAAFMLTFGTEAEKQKAADKAWNDLASRHAGSDEAAIAHFYMGINAADRGNSGEAEKHLKQAIDAGEEPYASQARLSLATIYAGSTGKAADAEKLLREIVNKPTVLVSKEQATLNLARLIGKTRPDEARKLLEPLRTERGPISRAALTILGELPAK
ncbi:MAG TPA: hypothetical protein VES20_14560 [Bryobacteraceae bacterium]|nr:hypothetical protein [Bryobacteraceae bacterium]